MKWKHFDMDTRLNVFLQTLLFILMDRKKTALNHWGLIRNPYAIKILPIRGQSLRHEYFWKPVSRNKGISLTVLC